MTEITTRSPKDIRIDGGTQFRVVIDENVVKDYAGKMKEGKRFPPLVAFEDSAGELWLGDGFHRHQAAVSRGAESIEVEIRPGTRRDAILYSLSANADHGLRRSNDDIRKAVAFCLRDPELRLLPQQEIANLCGCTQPAVSKIKNELFPGSKQTKKATRSKSVEVTPAPETPTTQPPDNGYQALDTPEQIVAAIKDDERASVLSALARRSEHESGDDKLIKRMERLGLFTAYGEGWQKKLEWTALADDVQELLLGGDAWTQFEMALYKADRVQNRESSRYRRVFGRVKPLLEQLAQSGAWVYIRNIPYEAHDWLAPLIKDGDVCEHIVQMASDYDRRSFYHIDIAGCQKLGLGDCPEISEPPTREQLEAADKAEKQQQREKQQREEAERKAKLDPTQEANRERSYILSWDFTNLASRLKNIEYLDVAEARTILAQFEQAIKAAGLKPAKVEAKPVAKKKVKAS